MFEVVEDEKHGLVAEPSDQLLGQLSGRLLANAYRRCDGRKHEVRVRDPLERYEVRASSELVDGVCCCLYRKTGLADPARPCERH